MLLSQNECVCWQGYINHSSCFVTSVVLVGPFKVGVEYLGYMYLFWHLNISLSAIQYVVVAEQKLLSEDFPSSIASLFLARDIPLLVYLDNSY